MYTANRYTQKAIEVQQNPFDMKANKELREKNKTSVYLGGTLPFSSRVDVYLKNYTLLVSSTI